MESLVQRGRALGGRLYISKNARLIMPYHPALDRASESPAGHPRICTTGKGAGPTKRQGVLGTAKAYGTWVGGGPFMTEVTGEMADRLRARGNEYGAVTGRPRRWGWADAVALRYAARINGLDTIALTKLDVLDGCETVRICVGYRYGGEVLTDFPEEERIWDEAEPVYEELSGWQTSTHGMRDYAELPSKAREYVERLARLGGVAVSPLAPRPARAQNLPVSHSGLHP